MSWLLGMISTSISSDARKSIDLLTQDNLFSVDNGRVLLRSGGLRSTCHFSTEKQPQNFWLVLGSGIRQTENGSAFYSNHDWESLIRQPTPSLSHINGGFLLVRERHDGIEFFTDSIGFRTLYLTKSQEGIFFSTRLDWLVAIMPKSSINLSSFGSRWLLFNQITYESPLKNVVRLGSLGHAIVTARSIDHTYTVWNPTPIKTSMDDVQDLIGKFLHVSNITDHRIEVGISGGVDSRVLLSILLSRKNSFSAYTFGDNDEPDVRIARRMASQEHFPHRVFREPIPKVDDCITMINDYVGQANLNEPLTTLLRLRNIDELAKTPALMIDGAYGEVARRQYFNRIAIHGMKYLVDKNVEALVPFFRVHRADIFNEEAHRIMTESVYEQIDQLLRSMPPLKEIGLESYLDLMAVRSRIPNFGADEQARLDSIILNLMPFATLDFFNRAFSIPVSDRRDGIMFRRMIRRNRNSLVRYPFVKFGAYYPFWMTSVQSWGWSRIKSRLGLVYKDNALHEFLHHLKDYIIDTANSSTVRNNSLVDHQKVIKIVTGYFNGKIELGSDVNWWFTFELWRRKMEK